MNSRFFAVTAKCGHVGRSQYYEGTFYIRASTGSEAAAIARSKPRVKRDHKDAILWVEEITFSAYTAGVSAFKAEAYFRCKSKREQILFWDDISLNVREETDLAQKHRKEICREKFSPELRLKKPYKREKFILCADDLDIIAA